VLINNLSELGELIRRSRTARGLSQTELAGRVGATRQWVSRLEKGKNDIGTARLFAVLKALELNLDVRTPRPGGSPNPLEVRTKSLISPETLQALAQMAPQLRHESGSLLPSKHLSSMGSVLAGLKATVQPGPLSLGRQGLIGASVELSRKNPETGTDATAARDEQERTPGDDRP